jgi:uncharacterized membrane protein
MEYGLGFAWSVPGGTPTVILLTLAALAIGAFGVREIWIRSNVRHRASLVALRLSTLVLGVLVCAQPSWTTERVLREQGAIAVLVDASKSMQVREGGATRAELARGWMKRVLGAGQDHAEVSFVGEGVRPAPGDAPWNRYAADESESALSAAVAQVAEDPKVAAIVLVSDGADNGNGEGGGTGGEGAAREVKRVVERAGIKVHTVSVGTPAGYVDDAIVDVRADPVAFVRDEALVDVGVQTTRGSGTALEVVLSEGGAVVRTETVTVGADGRGRASIAFTPDREGRHAYEVSVLAAGDDDVPANNAAAFVVSVRRDRLRVLHVAGRPSWDERFLRSVLKRDPVIDLVSFFILRTHGDLTMAAPGEMALIPFPTDELFSQHLRSFDIVILQNFDYGPYEMAGYLPGIADYVEGGGSLVMVGGEVAFGAAGYGETPLAPVLPVSMPHGDAPVTAQFAAGRFEAVLDDRLRQHPIVELLPGGAENEAAWGALLPVEGLNRATANAASSQTLLRARPGDAPLVVVAEPGEGRSMAILTDTTWRWGMPTGGSTGDAAAFSVFWQRALRWLARDPTFEPCAITTPDVRVAAGSTVSAKGVFRDGDFVPLTDPVRWIVLPAESSGTAGQPLAEGQVTPDSSGRGVLEFRAPAERGVYRIRAERSDKTVLAEQYVVVDVGARELGDVRPDADFMKRLAAATGGKHYASPDSFSRLDAVDRMRETVTGSETRAPFSAPAALALLVALLGADWILRRRVGFR